MERLRWCMATRAWLLLLALGWFLGSAGLCGTAHAWWGGGHEILTRASVRALPGAMPAFLRRGEDLTAHVANDADLFKNRAVPQLADAEAPEHFFDIERLSRRSVPDTRYAFIRACAERGLDPSKVGLLPYAVAEWTERLTIAFAEHRRWPDDPRVEQKCLVYAGMLAHYAEDLCQPLHVTAD